MKRTSYYPTSVSPIQKKPETSFFDHNREEKQPFFAGKKGAGNGFFNASAPLSTSPTIQAKLSIGQPNDKYEQEADTMADKVVQRFSQSGTIQRSTPPVEEEKIQKIDAEKRPEEMPELQKSPVSPVGEEEKMQMKCMDCEEKDKPVQRKANGETTASPSIESRLSSTKGSGSPLANDTRSGMESAFGADFSGVRVHTGSEAVQMSQDLNAHAFTHGSDLYFNSGKYNPSNTEGSRLLAHELTHTVQQNSLIQRKPATLNEPGLGTLLGAGDVAEQTALKTILSFDTMSVSADTDRVDEIISDIDKNQPTILEGEKKDPDMIDKYGASTLNTATKSNLQIFKDKLGVTKDDTESFASQFRIAYADYNRLVAEGSEYLSATGVESDSPIDALTSGYDNLGKDSLKIDDGQIGLERFRAARKNLNTAAFKMDGELKGFRGASQSLQSALYRVKSKAVAAKGTEASDKLKSVRAEIEEMSKNVGLCVKAASALSGVVGKGTEVGNMIGKAHGAGEPVSKLAVIPAASKDIDNLALGKISTGDPSKIAESLVTLIGEHVNKEKIATLRQTIDSAAAEEKAIITAADGMAFSGFQSNMEAAAAKLSLLVTAYQGAKSEMSEARDVLMAQLTKKGEKRGKNQARSILFLTDADRFLAQVRNAISNGRNQQSNAKDASGARKKLRGSSANIEIGDDNPTQKYWRAKKRVTKGTLWGTRDYYELFSVSVTFNNSSNFDYNDIVQGGEGMIEGAGGVEDSVAKKIIVLEQTQTQVQQLQSKIQSALGLGEPGINA
jgi:Domain of unknown function (DUF4157)